MKKKKAVVTVELVDESSEEENSKIAQELLDWFREDAVSIPWVKKVEDVTVKDELMPRAADSASRSSRGKQTPGNTRKSEHC